MAPAQISMMFSAMLIDVFQDRDGGFPIRYRFDDKLFNLRRLQAIAKVQTEVVDALLHAVIMAKNATTEREKMQESMDQVSQACDNYDLKINIKD